MVAPTTGAVVLIPFPFSDLSQAKLRPAVVLANSGRGDWILCQVTSNPYGDAHSIEITDDSFDHGSLRVTSYARAGKLFTANQDLIVSQVAILNFSSLKSIIEAVIEILRKGLKNSIQ
ncbi:MAG: type II toxin-antitoxin system PemK/MazF family toxin [Desulfomonilaceae bacterium]